MSRPPATPEVTENHEGGDGVSGEDLPASGAVPGRHERARTSTGSPVDSGGTRYREDSGEQRFEQVLDVLRDRVRNVEFTDGLPGAEEGRTARTDILHQLDDYVLPRVRNPDTPLLIAVAGSTGAGKSTLVNSLVGEQVTTTGVRRPTTNSPVLACNPADMDWFSETFFLPAFPRVRQQGLAMPGKDGMLVLAPSECMPQGIAVLDTPDVDSAVAAHHEFAATFLDTADLWLFVTTSRRYADARVWEFLQVARDRNTSLGVVLSRVPERGRDQLLDHFNAMLGANGLGNAARFAIPETDQIRGERFTANTADAIRNYLADVTGELAQRDRVTRRTFRGVIESFRSRVPELARQVETQVEAAHTLDSAAQDAFTTALSNADAAVKDGSLLRGTLLARWQDIAASGVLARTLRTRGKRRSSGTGGETEDPRVTALQEAIRDSLEALVVAAAERAGEEVIRQWDTVTGGRQLAERFSCDTVAADLSERVRRAVAEWQRRVTEMVSADGAAKRSVARFVSFDQNAFTLVLMVQLLGYEAVQESLGRTTPSPQRLLRGLFGAESLRSIDAMARDDLLRRIGTLLHEERSRFTDVLAAARIPGEDDAVQLYQATYNLEIAR